MHTSLLQCVPFGALLSLTSISGAYAKPQQGLPHEVTNLTTAEPIYTPAPAVEPSLNNDTLTAPGTWSHPWLCGDPPPPSIPTVYSLIYPSPDASPVEVTAQSQVVTSFQPEMTWCVGPARIMSPVAAAPFFNKTSYAEALDGTSRCETVYAPVETTVCATTLTGLATKVVITDCEQQVTFSTECGFTLETPEPTTANNSVLITPAPTVKRMSTYWLAPWQLLTAGETPSDVDVKICTVLDNADLECETYQEIWEVVVVTRTSTTTRTFDFTATVTGPGTVYVETLQAFITDTTETLDLSTILLIETEVEIESTSSARKTSTDTVTDIPTVTVTPTSTVFITETVVRRPTNATVEVTPEDTTTVRLTSVITQTKTTTVRRPRPRTTSEMPGIAPEDF